MPQLALQLISRVEPTQVLAAEELIEQQLGGLPVQAAVSPAQLAQDSLASQRLVEHALGLLLAPQQVTEDSDLLLDEWQALGFVRTSYPVVEPLELHGGLTDEQKLLAYPRAWLQCRRAHDASGLARQVQIVPQNGAAVVSQGYALSYTTLTMPLALGPGRLLRNYWRVRYVTGFTELPAEIVSLVGRLAAVLVMYRLANVVLAPGLQSQSLSIDGLSQSLSASNPYAATIKGYLDDAKVQLEQLRGVYRGLTFIVA